MHNKISLKSDTQSHTQAAAQSHILAGHPRAPTRTAATTKTAADPRDALSMLRQDHEAVSQLFADYDQARTVSRKKALVAEIGAALSVHMQIEEEMFYPAVKDVLKNKLLLPEAKVEHAGLKDLLAQIEGVEPGEPSFDAKVKVLSEYVEHHVKEEQDEMFPKIRSSSLDTIELGDRMLARREDLLAQAA